MRNGDLLSTAGSQSATNEGGNKIVTVGRRTHVTWQDVTPEGYFNRARTLDLDTGEWSPTYTLGSAYDDHARAVLVADAGGFLHAVLSGHNTACTYRRSLVANDASAWTDPVEIADGTYPCLVCGPDGNLYLGMRNGAQNGLELYRRPPDGPWHHVGKVIDRPAEYTGYACFACGLRLRRRRRAAPGVRHLRRHSRAARHPPGDRLPAVTGRRTDVAHLPRRAGADSGSPVRHGRTVSEHRPAARTDPSAGHDRAGQHRAGPGRHAPRPLPLPPEPGR